MNEVFFLVEEALEGGYTAKAIGESIFTEADTMEELRANIKEAVHCHFDDDKLPKIIRLHLVKEELLAV
jgi:predicted RNase H-like HicB family nuclease